MNGQQKPLGIHDYIEIGFRRKWYIIFPVVLSIVISYFVYTYLPKVYRATTLILVQPQQVPQSYIQSTITASVSNRLNTISQEILSRTRLEKVIQEFNLFWEARKKAPMEEIVEKMRKSIEITVVQARSRDDRSQNAFSISFEGEEPKTVMMVTNKLASLFIEENLKVRELQAEGTTKFLSKELQMMEEQLKEKEQSIRGFKERNLGQLPQQLEANLRILERLQQQFRTTSENIKAAEDRSILLQNQIDQFKNSQLSRIQASAPVAPVEQPPRREIREEIRIEDIRIPEDPLITQWNNLKRDLGNAQTKYTEKHPDVIDLKEKVAKLEPIALDLLKKQEDMKQARLKELQARLRERTEARPSPPPSPPPLPSSQPDLLTQRLITQYEERYHEARLEAQRLRGEATDLEKQILLYQKRIEETPRREQELVLLTRDYDLLKTNYQSLLDKKIQAQMAESLERKQQGEQFKILDSARMPEKPVRPDRDKILLIGLFLGLVSGLGLAWFRESLDESFHSESELAAYLDLPVLAAIPNLQEERSLSAKD